jgi:hypothetical protein
LIRSLAVLTAPPNHPTICPIVGQKRHSGWVNASKDAESKGAVKIKLFKGINVAFACIAILTIASVANGAVTKPFLTMEPKALDAHRVQFTINTNLPFPIKISAGIDLKGQKPDDIYIGYYDFFTLTGPKTTVILDTSKSNKPLPAATYNATVEFHPNWSENVAVKGVPKLHAEKQFQLIGSGGSAADTVRLNERQRWVISNVAQDTHWNRAAFEQRLGKSIKGRSVLSHLHDAYYFPGAGMTMLVNRTENKVTTWEKGNSIAPPNATKSDYERRGLKWPLSVDAGYLGCDGSAVWFATLEGATYAVNGVALSRYKPIDPIWLPDKKLMESVGVHGGPTVRISIGDLVEEGLKHCS